MMVAPEREVPGISANAWAKPTLSASFQSISSTESIRAPPDEEAAAAFAAAAAAAWPRRPAPPPLDPQDDEPTDDESHRHGQRTKQESLDVTAEREPEQRRRHERHEHIDGEALRLRLRGEAGKHRGEAHPIFPDDGQHCPCLDGNGKDLALLVIEIEQVPGQDQVARGGNRKEFRKPFDDAEHQGFEQQGQVHRALLYPPDISHEYYIYIDNYFPVQQLLSGILSV